MCDNSVEYVVLIMACFYCNLVVIPLKPISEKRAKDDIKYLCKIRKEYKVKRLFIDEKLHAINNNNNTISKLYKHHRNIFPKITVFFFFKLKIRNGVHIGIFKNTLKQKHSYKAGVNINTVPTIIWVDSDKDVMKNLHILMNPKSLLNICKVLKETLQLKITTSILSLDSYTCGLDFVFSCLIGIYVGTLTSWFSLNNIMNNPKDFLMAIQNTDSSDLYFKLDTFHKNLYKISEYLMNEVNYNKSKHPLKNTSPSLSPDIFRNAKKKSSGFLYWKTKFQIY